MKCPHCDVAIHPNWNYSSVYPNGKDQGWHVKVASCPDCNEDIVQMAPGPVMQHAMLRIAKLAWVTTYPKGLNRRKPSKEVPTLIAKDYIEASEVLPISSKASAALSRRCLQNILHDNGYKGRDLNKEIGLLLVEPDPKKAIPESLRTVIDGIRHFGNFSAHPVTDQTSLQVIPVEAHEAEWCLDILDEVFEHFYIRPERAKVKKAELDAKLKAAGKNPSK